MWLCGGKMASEPFETRLDSEASTRDEEVEDEAVQDEEASVEASASEPLAVGCSLEDAAPEVQRHYAASMRLLTLRPEAMSVSGQHPELHFDYGMSLEKTSFKIIVNVTWHAKSMQELLRYAALYINKDVHLGWDTTVRSTELLGDYSATEATWHVKGLDGAGVKTDDVLRRSWLLCSGDFDAWLVERSVEAAVPCESGYTRNEVLNFTAMRGSTAGGYALEVRTVIGISPGVLTMTVLGLMPAWVLRSALGSSVKNAVKGTPQHVKKHAEVLDALVSSSPVTPFFKELQQRIER